MVHLASHQRIFSGGWPPWHIKGSVWPNVNTSQRWNWVLMEARWAETGVETETWACMNLINSLKIQIMCKMLEHIRGGCWLHDEKCSAEVNHSRICPSVVARCANDSKGSIMMWMKENQFLAFVAGASWSGSISMENRWCLPTATQQLLKHWRNGY